MNFPLIRVQQQSGIQPYLDSFNPQPPLPTLEPLDIEEEIKQEQSISGAHEGVKDEMAETLLVGRLPVYIKKNLQTLKDIAHAIRFLIATHEKLDMKDLSFLLYELVSQTPFGCALAQGHQSRWEEIKQLKRKYIVHSQNIFEPVVKTIRRRLYDVINVLLAARVIIKTGRMLRLDPTFNFAGRKQDVRSMRLQSMRKKLADKQASLVNKKRLLKERVQKYIQIRKFEQHSKQARERGEEGVYFPIVIINMSPTPEINGQKAGILRIRLQENQDQPFEIFTEMDLISKMFQVTPEEVKNFHDFD